MTVASSVTNLRLKFPGQNKLIFKDFSISLKKGEKVLLLGPSGCGKSTLLQVLSGLIPKTIDVPVKYEHIKLPDSWGYVFQDPDSQFCMPYVDEEIAFVLENLQVPREEMDIKIDELLSQVGLNLEKKHTSIQSLSGGMKQRLAIASVLAHEPKTIFLDEPTALLDQQGSQLIWDTVKSVAQDKTVIIVEHKIDEILDFIDRVIVFDPYGEVIADGDVHSVFSVYKKQLQEYGIWYPGVWDDYLKQKTNCLQIPDSKISKRHSLLLSDFRGYRKNECMISVDNSVVASGEWICIKGENGAGKSTLLLSLMQLLKTKGTFKMDHSPIHRFNDLKEHAYFVFQNPEYQFVTNTVFDEIAYSLRSKKENEVYIQKTAEEILSRFNLLDHKHQNPFLLSLGQKRRLSVATAFIKNPVLLLLDEPTFGQDSKNTFHLLETLEKERQNGMMILMVTHDLNIMKHFATRIWEVETGELKTDLITKREKSSEDCYVCND